MDLKGGGGTEERTVAKNGSAIKIKILLGQSLHFLCVLCIKRTKRAHNGKVRSSFGTSCPQKKKISV